MAAVEHDDLALLRDMAGKQGGEAADRVDILVDRADELQVLSVQMPVLAATDILITKLMALEEHYCDFSRLLPVARALREQVDWEQVGRDVAANDFAVVFLVLLDRLGVVPGAAPGGSAGGDG